MEQTENVIAMIQLMREYLDAEQGEVEGPAIAVMPVLTNVVNELATWAALRGVRIRVMGTCTAELRIKAPWMRRALEYLLSAMIERQPGDSEILVVASENPPGAWLRIEGERGLGMRSNSSQPCEAVGATMRRVRIAIAVRVLENAGVAVAYDDGSPGVVLHLPPATE